MKSIAVILMLALATTLTLAKDKKAKDKNVADYPLIAHVVSSNGAGTGAGSVTYGNGVATTTDSDGKATVRFRIADRIYVGGWGCRKHVLVGADVHARLEKNKLYILTDEGETCNTHLRSVQEIPK
jgi:hypothetical protein